jgi:exosome complex component RRP41
VNKLGYDKRFDGRKIDETREIKAKVGVIEKADGSAMFQIGKTIAYAAVYGPRNLFPKFMQDPRKGILRCSYNMMPFSGSGNRVRPGPNRRAKEIALVTQKALLPVLDLKDFPNAVVDVFIELPQTDAGTRCAGICAASMALADAGFTMKDLVCSISVGRVDDKIVLDLNYDEEAYPDGPVADIPVAILAKSKKVTLLQMDGELTPKMLEEALELAKSASDKIFQVQRDALKAKFTGEKQ